MTSPSEYREVWKALCASYDRKKRYHIPVHMFAALRLSGWRSLRTDEHQPHDVHEMVLKEILSPLHRPGQDPDLTRRFKAIAHERPHSPIEALCSLRIHVPELENYLGLSNSDLIHALRETGSKVVYKVLPKDWKGDNEVESFESFGKSTLEVEHVAVLIRSVEIWLEAFYRV